MKYEIDGKTLTLITNNQEGMKVLPALEEELRDIAKGEDGLVPIFRTNLNDQASITYRILTNEEVVYLDQKWKGEHKI